MWVSAETSTIALEACVQAPCIRGQLGAIRGPTCSNTSKEMSMCSMSPQHQRLLLKALFCGYCRLRGKAQLVAVSCRRAGV